MRKVFYAIDIKLVKITADVDEYDVTIDAVRHPPKRETLMSFYRGDFTKALAKATYDECSARMKAPAEGRETPVGG